MPGDDIVLTLVMFRVIRVMLCVGFEDVFKIPDMIGVVTIIDWIFIQPLGAINPVAVLNHWSALRVAVIAFQLCPVIGQAVLLAELLNIPATLGIESLISLLTQINLR